MIVSLVWNGPARVLDLSRIVTIQHPTPILGDLDELDPL